MHFSQLCGLAKLWGKVITRTLARPLTVSDNPNDVQSLPNFAKPLDIVRKRWTTHRAVQANFYLVQPDSFSNKMTVYCVV